MAASPAFAATPNVGAAMAPATLDTSLTTPSNTATAFTAGSSGSKVEEITVQGVLTTVAGVVNVFLHRGSTYYLIDQFLITVVTSSTTAVAYRQTRTYENLQLISGDTLQFTVTVAGLQSGFALTCYGGDY